VPSTCFLDLLEWVARVVVNSTIFLEIVTLVLILCDKKLDCFHILSTHGIGLGWALLFFSGLGNVRKMRKVVELEDVGTDQVVHDKQHFHRVSVTKPRIDIVRQLFCAFF